MKKKSRKMPSHLKILEYWHDESMKYHKEHRTDFPFKSFFWDEGEVCCFACGVFCFDVDIPDDIVDPKKYKSCLANEWKRSSLERCHIHARGLVGSDLPSNFALMCYECHRLAPNTVNREVFFNWARQQDFGTRRIQYYKNALAAFGVEYDALEHLRFLFTVNLPEWGEFTNHRLLSLSLREDVRISDDVAAYLDWKSQGLPCLTIDERAWLLGYHESPLFPISEIVEKAKNIGMSAEELVVTEFAKWKKSKEAGNEMAGDVEGQESPLH